MRHSGMKNEQIQTHVRPHVVKILYQCCVCVCVFYIKSILKRAPRVRLKTSEWRASTPVASKTYNLPQGLETHCILPSSCYNLLPLRVCVCLCFSLLLCVSVVTHKSHFNSHMKEFLALIQSHDFSSVEDSLKQAGDTRGKLQISNLYFGERFTCTSKTVWAPW